MKDVNGGSCNSPLRDFNRLALELFALQFQYNAAYRKICEARKLTPEVVEHWTQIPAVPTAAFKELELSCIPPVERTVVFHSSGTTEQKPSRHFHSPESLKMYEASLIPWFIKNVLPDLRLPIADWRLVCLTPPPAGASFLARPHVRNRAARTLVEVWSSAFRRPRKRGTPNECGRTIRGIPWDNGRRRFLGAGL